MEKRPVVQWQLSSFDRFADTASLILLVFLWSFTLFAWFNLPAVVPAHFNAAGEINSYSSKATTLVLPVIGTFIFALMTLLNKHPHTHNYLVKITKDNAVQQYTLSTRLLRFMKLAVLIIFSSITVAVFLIAKGTIAGLGAWFLPSMLIIIFVPTIYMIVRSFRMK
jgi:uncharacterized membrane protein